MQSHPLYVDTDGLQTRLSLHKLYSQNPLKWHNWIFSLLPLRDGCNVLELGCGTCELWKQNAKRLPELNSLVLSDNSDAMLREAERIVSTVLHQAKVEKIKAEDIPLPSGSIDLVIANHMLYHTEVFTALGEIYRVLKPGGMLSASCNGANHMRQADELLYKHIPTMEREDSATRFGIQTAPHRLGKLFHEIRIIKYPDHLWVTNPAHVIDYLRSIFDPDLVAEVEADLVEEISSEIDTHGGFKITKDVALIVANKPALE